MTLSIKTYHQLAIALTPEVIEYIFNSESWIDFLQTMVVDAITDKLGKIDEEVLYELSLSVMDRINLIGPTGVDKTSNSTDRIKQ
jgi:hypothetical protein